MKNTFYCITLSLLMFTLLVGCAGVRELPESGAKLETPTLGVRLRVTLADAMPDDSQLAGDQLLRVVNVKPGQSAEAAGIQVDDILLELNGKSVSGMADSFAILQDARWGDLLMAGVMRGDQVLEIPVILNRRHKSEMRQPSPPPAPPLPVVGVESTGPAANTNAAMVKQSKASADASIVSFTEAAAGDERLLATEPRAAGSALATVVVDQANVRAEASTTSELLMSLPQGTEVMITDEMGGWFRVVTQDGRNIPGYMHGSLVAQ